MIIFFVPETAYVGQAASLTPSNIAASEKLHCDVPDAHDVGRSESENADKEKHAGSIHAETTSADQHTEPTSPAVLRKEQVWWKQIPVPFFKFLDAPVFLCAIAFALIFGWTVGMTIISKWAWRRG